jgi:mono/diheme cytochrome c family protein/peroxiredoxin
MASQNALLRGFASACGLLAAFVIAIYFGHMLRLNATAPAAVTSAPADHGVQSAASTTGFSRGEIVYQLHCAKCHGPDGHGDPEAMAAQKPPPRDFVLRPWHFEPTSDSIRRVALEGIAGTAMPSHRAALNDSDVDAVVEHVLRLATGDSMAASQRSALQQALVDAGFVPEPAPGAAAELPLVDADGNCRSLADERGRIVLLQFWGTTCEHCLQTMPKLEALAEQWQSQGITVLSVCADAESAADAQQAVNQMSPETRVWTDESGLAIGRFDIHILPTVWLIDSAGRSLGVAHGMLDWESQSINRLFLLLSQRDFAENQRGRE